MKKLSHLILFVATILSSATFAKEKAKDLDKDPPIYREMGVLQDKWMDKGSKVLLSSYVNLEFSENPYGIYFMNFNPGYAFNDFWEIYLNVVPFFLTRKRPSNDYVDGNKFPDSGKDARIKFSEPKYQVGGELLWAFGYGKAILFSNSKIQRSDTFVKAGGAGVYYDNGKWGWKAHVGLGKTYFVNKWMGLRATASFNMINSQFEDEAEVRQVFILEFGSVFYL